MDELAAALNMDPIALRLRNFAGERSAAGPPLVEQRPPGVLPRRRRAVRVEPTRPETAGQA